MINRHFSTTCSNKIFSSFFRIMLVMLMFSMLFACAQRGDDFFDAERFEAAADLYIQAAEQGDTGKMLRLAEMYTAGKIGYRRDYEQAVYWYQKAASQGVVPAMFELGFIFEFGSGDVDQDVDQSLHWYQQAAVQGNSYAQYRLAAVLARQLENYDGADAVDAYRWFLIGVNSAQNCLADAECQIVANDLFNYQWQLQRHLSGQQRALARQQAMAWLTQDVE